MAIGMVVTIYRLNSLFFVSKNTGKKLRAKGNHRNFVLKGAWKPCLSFKRSEKKSPGSNFWSGNLCQIESSVYGT